MTLGGTSRATQERRIIFFYGKGNENYELGEFFFVQHRIVSAVKRVDFVSERMSHIILRGYWCNMIVLNILAPSEEKSDVSRQFL
jgi:hypothetical protein